ncbi:MAG: hypothetical protein WD768_10755 [Phycisphaeraceae bacterium]
MRTLVTSALLIALFATTSALLAAHSKEVEARFDSTYGAAVRGVKSTRSTADDAKLAAVLLADAEKAGNADPFAVKLYEETWELGKLHTTGFPPAVDALQQLARMQPKRQLEMQENLLWLYEVIFRNAKGETSSKFGNAIVDLTKEIVEGKKKRAEYSDAIKLLTKGQAIARAIKSPKVDHFTPLIQELRPLAVIDTKIQIAKRALAKDVKDKGAMTDLRDHYLRDLDRPISAKTYTEMLGDSAMVQKMTLAGQPVDSLDASAAGELAGWYASMGDDGLALGRQNALIRAKVYYERALQLKAGDAQLKAGLDAVHAKLSALKVSEPEANDLARSRRDRLGITVAARPVPKPEPKPVPKPPKPDPTPKPPVVKPQPQPEPAPEPAMVEPKEVEPENEEKELTEEYWRNRKSIFDF